MRRVTAATYSPFFFDNQKAGSLSSARAVLGELFTTAGGPPSRVLDVGCGVGTWLRAALDLGAKTIRGFDGDWVPGEELEISSEAFTASDLVQSAKSRALAGLGADRFDLALSLEVAEHLPENCAVDLVSLLCKYADLVLFSAAVPYQGGLNHVNEQWPSYWASLFRDCGYDCFDFIRSRVWTRPEVDWWYAQNVLVFASGRARAQLSREFMPVSAPLPLLHPRKYLLQVAAEQELRQALVAATAAPFPGILASSGQVIHLERKIAQLRAAPMSEPRPDVREDGITPLLEAISLYDKSRAHAYRLGEECNRLRRMCADLQHARDTQLESLGAEQRQAMDALEDKLNKALARENEARRVAAAVTGSKSWKITAPLRFIATTGRRLLKRI